MGPRSRRALLKTSAAVAGSFVAGTGVGYTLATHLNSPPPRVQWQFESTARVVSSPTVVEGLVYVGSHDGNLHAVDESDGTERWHFETGDDVFSSPTVANDTVYVGSQDGNVYALSAEDGSEQWRFDTGDGVAIQSSPIVVDGAVYIGTWDDTLYSLAAGVEGSSEGSRVRLGTLGHHDKRGI